MSIQSLLDWIGVDDDAVSSEFSPSIQVQHVPGSGRGVFATSSIHVGTKIVTIPKRFLLNIQTILDHSSRETDPTFQPFYDYLLQNYSTILAFQLVGIYLCVESSRESFWTPFISFLPELLDFQECPLVQSHSQLPGEYRQYLDLLPISAQNLAQQVIDRFDHDFAAISALVDPYPLISNLCGKDRFLWAWMCINSRCLYMEQPLAVTKDCNFTMAPFVDFLNHSPLDACRIKITASGFNVFATTPYKSGDQLLFCYGPHSNEFLLAEYGFVLPSNSYDSIDVSSSILDLLLPRQKHFLQALDYLGEYTICRDHYSFRTQVALATSTEEFPGDSRPLQALINGQSDGSIYKDRSADLLKKVLRPVIQNSTEILAKLDSSSSHGSIKILHRNILDIASMFI